jgi:enoyl-CoA hydratase
LDSVGPADQLAGQLKEEDLAEENKLVRFERDGHVAIITIDRPAVRNAINGDVARGIEAGIDALEADPDLWVGILAGNGPVFSAGADLKATVEGQSAGMSTARGGFGGIVWRKREKPIIAAVDGAALAGGCEIVLACDLVVASKAARFGIPEVKRGLIAAAGGLFRLARQLPQNIAMELALTGDPIDAARAAEWGIVNVLTESGEALNGALALAARINANAPISVRLSRQTILQTRELDDAAAFEKTATLAAVNYATEDFAEGPRAFLEKRAPVWKGR